MEWFSQVVIVNVDDFGATPPSPALSRVCCYAFRWKYRRSLENHKVDSHSQCNVAESEGRDLTFSTTLCLAQLKNKSQLFEYKYDLLQGWIYLLSSPYMYLPGEIYQNYWFPSLEILGLVRCILASIVFFLFDFELSKAWMWPMWKIVIHSSVASGNWGPHNLAVTVMIVIWTTLEIKVIWTTLKQKWTAFHRHQNKKLILTALSTLKRLIVSN